MEGESYHQRRYWAELVQLKAHIYYLHLYRVEAEKKESRLNISLAVTSNFSLAAWAVSQSVPFVWAFLIAVSQAISSLKRFLPFEKRLEHTDELSSRLEQILLFAERRWYAVSEGRLTDDEIHDLIMEIKQRKVDAESEILANPLPERVELKEEAEQKTHEYFSNFYPTE